MKTTFNEAGPFNRIARETITNPHHSLKAKGLLTLILGFPEEWDFSIAGLRPFLQEGRESIVTRLCLRKRKLPSQSAPDGRRLNGPRRRPEFAVKKKTLQ